MMSIWARSSCRTVTSAMHMLQEEAELKEIVQPGRPGRPLPDDRLTLETAKMIREDFLQQNAFIDEDAYSSYLTAGRLLDTDSAYDDRLRRRPSTPARTSTKLFNIPARERIGRAKMVPAGRDRRGLRRASIDEMKSRDRAKLPKGGEDE